MAVDQYKIKFYKCSKSPKMARKKVEKEVMCLLFKDVMMLTDIKERAKLFLNSVCFYFLHQEK